MNTANAYREDMLRVMTDGDIIGVMEIAVQELARAPSTREPLIRFWTSVFALLDTECERRRNEIDQLERLYFQ